MIMTMFILMTLMIVLFNYYFSYIFYMYCEKPTAPWWRHGSTRSVNKIRSQAFFCKGSMFNHAKMTRTHITHTDTYIDCIYLWMNKMSAFDLKFYKGNSYLHVFIVWKISLKNIPNCHHICIYIFNHIYPLVVGCTRAGVLAQRLGIPSSTLLMLINLLYLF